MTGPPPRAQPPLGLIAIASLLVLAIGGAAVGALSGDAPSPGPMSAATVTPAATATPPVVAGGSAWPAETPTPVPTPVPATPTPTPAPSLGELAASLEICRDQRDGRCTDRVRRVEDHGFVVILSFEGASAGDTFAFRLDGPDGQTVNGGSITVNGSTGRAWSTFRGSLPGGDWAAVVTREGEEVARAEFEAR